MNRRGFLAALVAAPVMPLAAPEKSVAASVNCGCLSEPVSRLADGSYELDINSLTVTHPREP